MQGHIPAVTMRKTVGLIQLTTAHTEYVRSDSWKHTHLSVTWLISQDKKINLFSVHK